MLAGYSAATVCQLSSFTRSNGCDQYKRISIHTIFDFLHLDYRLGLLRPEEYSVYNTLSRLGVFSVDEKGSGYKRFQTVIQIF